MGNKIAFTADQHLCTVQYGMRQRYLDFMDALRAFGSEVERGPAKCVITGGDLFDSPRPDAFSVCCAKDVFGRLSRSGVRVMGIDGNHDMSSGKWLQVCGVEDMSMRVSEYMGRRFLGVPFMHGTELVERLKEEADRCELEHERIDAVVMHLGIAEMSAYGTSDSSIQELAPILSRMGVKAVLMGHIHIRQVRDEMGIRWIYPGSTEMKSMDEPEGKSFELVDIDTWETERVSIPTRGVSVINIDREDMVARLSALPSFSDGSTKMHFLYVSSCVSDGCQRVAEIVRRLELMARIIPVNNECSLSQKTGVVDRSAGISMLQGAIEAFFEKGSDEDMLVNRMLMSPQSADSIAREYLDGESGWKRGADEKTS